MTQLTRPVRRKRAKPCFARIEAPGLDGAPKKPFSFPPIFGGAIAGAGAAGPGVPDGPLSLPRVLDSLSSRLPAFLGLSSRSTPDRSRLNSVEDFFRYTEEEGVRAVASPVLSSAPGPGICCTPRLPWPQGCARAPPGSITDATARQTAAGKRFFEELDRDGDGRVKLEDLRVAMRCVPVARPGYPRAQQHILRLRLAGRGRFRQLASPTRRYNCRP